MAPSNDPHGTVPTNEFSASRSSSAFFCEEANDTKSMRKGNSNFIISAMDYSRRFLNFDNSGGTEPEKLLSLRSRYSEENKTIIAL